MVRAVVGAVPVVVRPVVRTVAVVPRAVVVAASNSVIEAVLLMANVSDRIVASVAGLSDSWSRDSRHRGQRDQSSGIARMHMPFLSWGACSCFSMVGPSRSGIQWDVGRIDTAP